MNMHTGEKPHQYPFIWEHKPERNHIIVINVTRDFPQMIILEFIWRLKQGRNIISAANGSRNFLWRLSSWTHKRCTLVRNHTNTLSYENTNRRKTISWWSMWQGIFRKWSSYSSFEDIHRGETILVQPMW